MLYTVRPTSGIGKKLSEAELEEFNQITYDKIKSMKNLPKLIRLEQYMREEGFPQTADLARQMVVELGGKDSCPLDREPQFADVDAEFDAFLQNFDSWQASVKGADHHLRDLQLAKEDGQPGEGEQAGPTRTQRRNAKVIENSIPLELPKKPQKKDVRSGRAYYELWDKYAADAEKEIEEEEKASAEAAKTKPKLESKGDKKKDTKNAKRETLQQRLLSIGRSKSPTEREWFAEREREKGNDLFNAKEYSSSLDAYTMAIELCPGSSLAYGNRAAANIKLKKWEEAHKDCCKALELDPAYVKALMRRGFANLEMDKPEEAMQDLQAALALDPNSQETQSLIQRTEPILKKLQERRAEELELERKKAEEAELEKSSAVTVPPATPRRSKRITIEEVDESPKDVGPTCNTHPHKEEGEAETKREEPKKVYSWPSKPHKGKAADTAGPPPSERKTEPSATSVRNAGGQDAPTADGKNFGVVVHHEPEAPGNGAGGGIEYPPEVLEAMAAQESIPEGHVAFGHKRKGGRPGAPVAPANGDTPTEAAVESLKKGPDPGMLAEEWRLNGNSFFARGDVTRAEECYTTSLKYCHSPATLSNRAMCWMKLKKYKGAEDDASAAISTDATFHKAYYRRGLARRALGRLQEAKADFQEVLKATPGDQTVMAELESLESQYIPMRVGPMMFEEVDDKTDGSVPVTPRPSREATSRPPKEGGGAPATPRGPSSQSSHGDAEGSHRVPQGDAPSSPTEAQGGHADVQCSQPGSQSSRGATQGSPSSQVCPQGSQAGAPDGGAAALQTPHAPNGGPPHPPESADVARNGGTPSGARAEENDDLEWRAEEEKEKGNACFKKGRFTLAVECYTRSLELMPARAAVLANRALCYIHLREYKKAVDDSNKAILIAPGYTKAFHRRATALHGLGDLQGALHDYQVVATFSPNDKKLKKDIEGLDKEIERAAAAKATPFPTPPKSRPILTSEPPEDDNEFLKPVKTTIYKTQEAPPPAHKNAPHQATPGTGPPPTERVAPANGMVAANGTCAPPASGTVSGNGAAPHERSGEGLPAGPATPRKPNTALEFERVCGALKGQPKAARDYVKLVEVARYPALFKESLSAGILRCFIHVLRKGFMPDDPTGAVAVLRGLTKVKRFALTLLLMAPAEKQGLETLFYWLEYSSDAPAKEVAELRSLYQIP